MRIGVVGAGYVGLTAGTVFAEHGNDVICVEIDETKVASLNEGICPIYEPGLADLLQKNLKAGRLRFTSQLNDLADHEASSAEIIFLAVGTPTRGADDAADLSALYEVAQSLGPILTPGMVIANKSTVPVGTCERIQRILSDNTDVAFSVASNPEFLKEGSAVRDFMQPDRVVLGVEDDRAAKLLTLLYRPFCRTSDRIMTMGVRAAELTKYACNAYLAMRISFINDIANLCDAAGADVEEVRKAMGQDSRIGSHFLFPGIGYGGACFPKDTRALLATAREHGLSLDLVSGTQRINEAQKLVIVRKIRGHFEKKLNGLTFAMWGLTFKPQTDDLREAPSLRIAENLIADGAKIVAHDPEAGEAFKRALGPAGTNVTIVNDPYLAAEQADALILCTEWRQYRSPDFKRLKRTMKQPVVFDGRNQWSREYLEDLGFSYHGIGR